MTMANGLALLSANALVLEDQLASGLRSTFPAPALVIAPTQRLIDHLSLSLARRFGALAQVHFFHHSGLANALLWRARSTPVRRIHPLIVAARLIRILDPSLSALERYLSRHPRAIPALLSTFRDLRDCGWLDASLPRRMERLSSAGRATLELFVRLQEDWHRWNERGLGDEASAAARAAQVLGSADLPWRRVFHYGAYDLTAVHARLIKALAGKLPVSHFVPTSPDERLQMIARRMVRGAGERHPTVDSTAHVPRVERIETSHPRQEIKRALRRVLQWQGEDGIELESTAILARRMEPFLPHLAAEARNLGVPIDAFPSCPGAEQPAAARCQFLLSSLLRGVPVDEFLADVKGLSPSKIEERWRTAGTTCRRLEVLAELAEDLDAGWFADSLRRVAGQWSEWAGDLPEFEHVRDLLGVELGREIVNSVPSPPPSGGVRVLEMHEARAIPWKRAILLGCTEDLLPSLPSEDVFLPDSDRRILAQLQGIDLRTKAEARDQEELLFDLLVHSVSERLEISWHRADSSLQVRNPSAFLERLDLAGPSAPTRVYPAHPREELAMLHDETSMLTRTEALTLVGLSSAGNLEAVETLARTIGSGPSTLEALKRLRAIESFQAAALPYDGDFGTELLEQTFSASSLNMLGRCPLQFAFRHRLRIGQAPADPTDLEWNALEMGTLVHKTLELLYSDLFQAGQPLDPAQVENEASRRLPEMVEAAAGELERHRELRRHRIPPRLARWKLHNLAAQLLPFVRWDLRRLGRAGAIPAHLELKLFTRLNVGDRSLPLQARIDRISERPDKKVTISDYKWTSLKKLKEDFTALRRRCGSQIQLQLYWLAARAEGFDVESVEALALRNFDPDREDPCLAHSVDDLEEQSKEVTAALQTLLAVVDTGRYPLRSDFHQSRPANCSRCDYRRACRHRHVPTLERVEKHPAHAAFFGLSRRKKTETDEDEE